MADPSRPPRSTLPRDLGIAAGIAVLLISLVVGFGRLRTLSHTVPGSGASPAASTTPIPWITAEPSPASITAASQYMTPSDAMTLVAETVTTTQPLLLPTAIAADSQVVVSADADQFRIEYHSGTSSIALMVLTTNLGLPEADVTHRTFRGVPARYEVNSLGDPTQGQFLLWTEPGTSKLDPKGVPYFLKVGGLSAAEFWRVADSIGPLPLPRRCQASDLQVVFLGGVGATGHMIENLLIADRSSTPCFLQGTPRLSLLLAGGTAVDAPQIDANPTGPAPGGPVIMRAALTITSGNGPIPGTAALSFEWSYCPQPSPPVTTIRLQLHAGEPAINIPVASSPRPLAASRCDTEAVARGLAVGPIQATGLQGTNESPQASAVLSGSISVPATVAAGHPLQYEVTLTNTSKGPIVMDSCPSYFEYIDFKRASGRYLLNCAPVHILAPGQSATFAMVLDVPADVPPGSYHVAWVMDPPGPPVDLKAPLTITAS